MRLQAGVLQIGQNFGHRFHYLHHNNCTSHYLVHYDSRPVASHLHDDVHASRLTRDGCFWMMRMAPLDSEEMAVGGRMCSLRIAAANSTAACLAAEVVPLLCARREFPAETSSGRAVLNKDCK